MGLLHLKLNFVSYEAFGYVFVCKWSDVRKWLESERMQNVFTVYDRLQWGIWMPCLIHLLFTVPKSSPVSFCISEWMLVDKKQDLSLVTAEGIQSKGNRGSSTFMGLGRSWHGRQSSFLTHLPLLKRDETVSGYRCVRHFGKRKRGPWCNCLIDSAAGQRGLRSGSQGVWREKHCQGLGSVKVLTGEACWG